MARSQQMRDAIRGRNSMIATGHPLAAAAARVVLAAGGSAVDAAIAADAVMGVVEPMATGIGGDLQAMIVARDGSAMTYNGTGRAPAALSPDLLEPLPGQRIPERHPLSVTVPGAVRGWRDLHERYGKTAWSTLFTAAIEAAEAGIAVAPVAASEWRWFDRVLHADPECAQLYRAGTPPQAGDKFANPGLAKVLRGIARQGDAFYYSGEPAQAAERASRAVGGVLTASDFANHRGNYCEPLRRQFRGLTVLECPPNSHGCAVLDALGELEALALEPDSPQAVVQTVQATSRALEKARKTVADPAGTVCTVIVDRDGLAVTLMSSIFKRFGSGIAVPGCGFVLQNRGFGFAAPGHINSPAGNKRPYHTVIPAACLRDGRFHAGFGVVGVRHPADAMSTARGGEKRRGRRETFAQFCANRLVRRETEASPAIFFWTCSLPSKGGSRRPRRARVAHRGAHVRGCCFRKALVFRAGLKCGCEPGRRPRRRACVRARGPAPVVPSAAGKKKRAGVDSEKNRD